MVDPIPPEVKRVWNRWNIRCTILFSLALQIFLVLLAPYRKSTRKKLLIIIIWSAYLLADAAANFTVGLISNSNYGSQGSGSSTSNSPEINGELLAFWIPFLLLHLGGPDTITAFALEDNELWLRHLLGLGFQAVLSLYVFAQSLPKNRFWIPTALTFVAGFIKYLERTRALYLASLDGFRDSMLKDDDPGPNYAKIVEEFAWKRESHLPAHIITIPEPENEARATDVPAKDGLLTHLEVLHYGYKYFLIFKGLVVDLMFSFRERNESREFFGKRKAIDALRVIEVELNFIYEVLYTKVQVVDSIWGYICRTIAFGSMVSALFLFHFRTKRHDLNQFDVGITYTLLSSAVIMDVIALWMLVFSDWTYARIKDPDSNSGIWARICRGLFRFKEPWWRSCECGTRMYLPPLSLPLAKEQKKEIKHEVLSTPILYRRWSGSISSYNLISSCLKSHTRRIHKFTTWPLVLAQKVSTFLHLGPCFRFLADLIKNFKKATFGLLSCVITILAYIKEGISKSINNVVCMLSQFTCLRFLIKKTSEYYAHLRAVVVGSMGINDFLDEITYVYREPFTKELWEFIFEELKIKAEYADDPEAAKRISAARGEWVLVDGDTQVDRSTLMQYITDVPYDESILLWHIATDLCYYTPSAKLLDQESIKHREFSKILSDYMLYLLIWQPAVMSAVGGIGKTRFKDTCAEAERFFDSRGIPSPGENSKRTGDIEARACSAILAVLADIKPAALRGTRSKSVLFDASGLAKELFRLEEKGLDKWKLMSRVWVELISYAASHCRANTHAQQVSKGGELITLIWLLMAHFGLVEHFHFQMHESFQSAKLIMGK